MGLRNHSGRLDLGVSTLIDQVLGGKIRTLERKPNRKLKAEFKNIKSNQRG